MFYKMIENKCRKWYHSRECTVRNLITYIEKTGQMRDAQIEAIKVYLYLKIACGCKPLEYLFRQGAFNSIDLHRIELSTATREYLEENPAAAALFEYARLKDDKGEQVSGKLEKRIKEDPSTVDYTRFFHHIFYGISYTDYLFSLPMGSGKTYLMAAFIYLDLYLANNDPANPAFAHNFIIFAPSGLKSSVVPSLKTIQNFDPTWVIPEPAATDIKRKISFEVLDQGKTAKKSNKTKNPNVQKLANHQPFSQLFGLVIVTNAEKVILDRIKEKQGQINLFEKSEDERDRQANELRNLIGKLPSLSVFIDEVHHAVSNEIKLRAVITSWAQNRTVNSVVGFSGTPYLEKVEKFQVAGSLTVGTSEITNIVYYYPLLEGIGNFLKRPVVKIADMTDSRLIIQRGVREFLDMYKDAVYADGSTAKLGIYCGTIEKLEEIVYPLVVGIAAEYGWSSDVILRFHRGNRQYKAPVDSPMQFATLDNPLSRIRIVLLVQIAKEGWDCRSLTGIILSQEGDCPTNMVLQTSCRCLRQVVKGAPETALIYLNKSNADKLNVQLAQQQHISLKDFASDGHPKSKLRRFNRTDYLKLPKVDFYQLKVSYDTITVEKAHPETAIANSTASARIADSIIKTTDLTMDESKSITYMDDSEYGSAPANFHVWVYQIMKGGFGSPSIPELMAYAQPLRAVFAKITYEKEGSRYYSSKYNRKIVESNIRKAFHDRLDFRTREERIPEKASLLNLVNFTGEVHAEQPDDYYPLQKTVENIIADDQGKLAHDPKMDDAIRLLEETGNPAAAAALRAQTTSHKNKDRSFHYLPYRTDSHFEQTFLKEVLSFEEIEKLNLEVYYNGDGSMTEFKIKCYKKSGDKWKYIGIYTPDFLILRRRDDKIHKIIIVETKGKVYAGDPSFLHKKTFMETEFSRQNNMAYGYKRFDYLYIEDTLPDQERLALTHKKICEFFGE